MQQGDAGEPTEAAGTVIGSWLSGRREDAAATWATHASAFLGCGFRVQVPAHGGTEALAFARRQAVELATLLHVDSDDAPWEMAASLVERGTPLLVEGGWESVFRGPLGPPRTRLSVGRGPNPERHLPALELPWRVASGSDLSTLPLISTHEHRAALAHLHAQRPDGAVGLWRAPDGALVGSTAGALLALAPTGEWLHAAPGAGVVPSWTATRLAAHLESAPTRLGDTDGLRLLAVDAWGSLTVLTDCGDQQEASCATAWAGAARSGLASLLVPS